MDPITLAITNALANLGVEVIKDAYAALKAALQQKFGVKSELLDAVGMLEEKPESAARKALVQEAVASSGADQDPDLLQAANELIEKLKELPGNTVAINQDINIRGDRNIVTGQGNVEVNE